MTKIYIILSGYHYGGYCRPTDEYGDGKYPTKFWLSKEAAEKEAARIKKLHWAPDETDVIEMTLAEGE